MSKRTLFIPCDMPDIAIGDIPKFIACVLEPDTKIDFSETARAVIQIEHEDAIRKASLSGEIIGRNRLTRIKEPGAMGSQLERSVLTVDEANAYTSKFGVYIAVKPAPEESGRYTLEQAAKAIGAGSDNNEKHILALLREAVDNGDLPVYEPGSDISYKPTVARDFYEEIFSDDLNKWMESEFPRLSWRFPKPKSDPSSCIRRSGVIDDINPNDDISQDVRNAWDQLERKDESPIIRTPISLPEWVPATDKLDYENCYNFVFNEWEFSPTKVAEWIEYYSSAGDETDDPPLFPVSAPNGINIELAVFDKTMGRLANIIQALGLGRDEGVKYLEGNLAQLDLKIVSSTQSNNPPFTNPPQRKDEWFQVAIDMMREHKMKFDEYPNRTQAWSRLWSTPPKGYGITTVEDKGHEVALSMGGSHLSKSAFNKRWDNWNKSQ